MNELDAWKNAHKRLFDEMTAIIQERDTLRKQLELAKEALGEIFESWRDSDKAQDYAIEAHDMAEIALAEIEKMGGEK